MQIIRIRYALAKAGYANIWPLFGSANQLLSALALIACAVYLKRTNRKGWMLWLPMGVMLAVTLTALGMQRCVEKPAKRPRTCPLPRRWMK